jgi:hypothetical protein
MIDPFALKIAAFVASVLEIAADPAVMAEEVIALKRDANAGISTIELQSAEGPAPFLVYHYVLEATGEEGKTGQELFDQDLATLTRATEQNTPGPRILAHATAEGEAYVLATTPEVFHTLTGVEPASEPEAPPIKPGKASAAIRKRSADNLLKFLRQADAEASNWLRAMKAEGEEVTLSAEESALALFLIDKNSIKNVLLAINVLIENAQDQAEQAMKRNGDGQPV